MRNLKTFAIVVSALFIALNSSAQITEIGLASFYADKYDGRVTASGDIFDQSKMTAAHRTLPFGTKVTITNISSKKSVIVVINDRGPFVDNRVIDLSKAAAKKLDFISKGVARVRVEVISLGKTSKQNSNVKKVTEPSSASVKQVNNVAIAASTTTKTDTKQNLKNNIEYYKIKSDLILPKGYGIQIASYKEAANLMKKCNEIKNGLSKDVIVQVADNGDNKVYRIIIGTFNTRALATDFNKKLNNRFPGSFIVNF